MSEQELKLHIPHTARVGVERALRRGAVTRVRLRALYFDTPTRELVAARVALRLRQEGRQWVQTLKMPGEHVLSRVEINHNRPGPILDLNVYVGTVAENAISNLKGALEVCYETDVIRLLRNIRTAQGSVEIALDTGVLRAGTLELPISEIEFELLSGKVDAIFTLGRKWQHTHGLILDARSKSERGDQLAQLAQQLITIEKMPLDTQPIVKEQAIASFWGSRSARPVVLEKTMTAAQALTTVTLECIDQIIRNAAILAEVDTADICQAGNAEHIHQLRVGIRRLRSAWSFFNGMTPLPALELRESIKTYFSLLGGTRDDDVLNETILPILSAAGQPPLVLDQQAQPTPRVNPVATHKDFQACILSLLESLIVMPETTTIIQMQTHVHAQPCMVQSVLISKLRKWHRQVLRDGLKFKELDIEARHELRKRAKKLRYALQFSEALLTESKLKKYRKQLSAVQDILGEMNDLAVARERFVGLRDTQPSAWFACGWITSRLDALTNEATEAFQSLEKTDKFWA